MITIIVNLIVYIAVGFVLFSLYVMWRNWRKEERKERERAAQIEKEAGQLRSD
jgi:uncharacterized membrane protein